MQTEHLINAGLWRSKKVLGDHTVNFGSNDYLGLSDHPHAKLAIKKSLEKTRIGSTSSVVLSGYSIETKALEEKFCHLLGFEKALLFPSGYQANIGVISGLLNRHSTLLCDRLCHASIIDGGILSRAKIMRYEHNHLKHIEELLSRHQVDLLITESVFSMEGAISPLLDISNICQNYNVPMMIDDAHGFGILGDNGLGAVDFWEFKNGKPDLLVIPFGKSLGASGAVVLGDQERIEKLIQQSRSYRYSTAISPILCQAVSANLDLIVKDRARRKHLNHLIHFFNKQAIYKGIQLTSSDLTPIKTIIIGDNLKALETAESLYRQGYYVGAIRPPTVPNGTARLRFSLTYHHTESQIADLIEKLSEALK